MINQTIPSRNGKIYDVAAFQENPHMIGFGRSFSLTVKESFTLVNIPEASAYPEGDINTPALKFRFNFSDSTIRNWDFAVYGSGDDGLHQMIKLKLQNLLGDSPEALSEYSTHECIVNL